MKRTTKMAMISRRPKKKVSRTPLAIILSAVFSLGVIVLVVLALAVTAGVSVYRYYQAVVPDGIQALTNYEQQPFQVSSITDRYGNTLQEMVDPNLGIRELVPLKQIPTDLINATIDTENRTFWKDPGVDPVRLLSSFFHDVNGRSTGLQGASTLTQQLVRLGALRTDASSPRGLNQATLQRKLKEIMIAIGTTRDIKKCNTHCRKEAILEMYLNTVPYGAVTYGVGAAAEYYFGKSVRNLDLAQCALLAGLPQAPGQYDPLSHLDLALTRQHLVLDGMLGQKDITQAQYSHAMQEQLHFVFKSLVSHDSRTTIESYFVDWLVRQYLNDPRNLATFHIQELQQPQDVYRGWIFQTTLDPQWQSTAQGIVTNQVASLAGSNVNDGALVAIDPRSNEIKAMVGGVGWNSPITGAQYNMAWQYRQPGSSFKPFVYLTAFMHGHFPAEAINDAFVQFPDGGQPGGYYVPRNYDLSYHGLVTIRKALANSYNVPAVKTLYNLNQDPSVAIKWVLNTANAMGYPLETQNPRNLGLSFALGADRGRLLEETNAYTIFANGGIYRPYMPILAIYKRNADGSKTLVWQYHTPKGVQVIAPQYAYLITSILSDTAAKVPAFGQFAYSYLGLADRPAATKTGTTNDFKDNLTLGYTPNLVTGVWVGNPDNSEMLGVTGVVGAAPIWHEFMTTVLANTPPEQFVQPPGIITATVALYAPPFSLPGLAVNGYGSTDIFAAGTVPSHFDQPALDDYSGKPQAVTTSGQPPSTTPGTTTTTTTSVVPGANGTNPCGGGRYYYTSSVVNGKTVYNLTCSH